MRIGFWLPVLLAVTGNAAAAACPSIEQRLDAAQLHEIGLSERQLELLNRYLCEQPTVDPAAAAPAATTPAVLASGYAGQEAGGGPAGFVGLDSGRIETRAKGTLSGWEPGTVFDLENGQRWQVLKGKMTLPKPMQDPEVVLVPGIAGRWFLQVDEDLAKARVFRID